MPNAGQLCTAIGKFLASADRMLFIKQYTNLNHLIGNLREAWQQTNGPVQLFKDAILAWWIPLSDNFIQRYGMAIVPYNLRFTLADSRRNVGLHAPT